MEYMLMPLRRYAEFTGRSRRMEFWMFALLNLIVYVVILGLMFGLGAGASMEDAAAGNYGAMFGGVGLLLGVWALAVLVPSIAVSVRRLHDRDMSGWWYLGFIVASFIPIVGLISSLAFLVLMALPGTAGENRFGPDPKGAADPAVFA